MREDFLHFLWRTKRLDLANLCTTEGESLQILQIGQHNHHAGPDFLEARIKIENTLWIGNIEMHLNSSEWIAHKHQSDKAYDNVILHVVLEEDIVIFRENGERIPCLEVKKRIPPKLSKTYQQLQHAAYWIPCQKEFAEVRELTKNLWLDRLLVERLEQKTIAIAQRLAQNTNNWEDTFYEVLARNFGVKVNTQPFELLAINTPHKLFAKYKTQLFQIEALLFGQSGLLDADFIDSYPNALKKEYTFLQKKHQLSPIKKESWRFLRMRPANFPTIRIAQFATLSFQSLHLFSKILEVQTLEDIEALLEVKLSDYWRTHYVFDKESKARNKTLGKNTIHLLVINAIVPSLFLYGMHRDEDRYKDLALALLEQIKPEKNSIIQEWTSLGMKPDSAYQTQALLQLKNAYCGKKRCLECAVGNAIFK